MDCTEIQYYHNGSCHPCLQCRPGLELSEDCGYGSGRLAYCIPCNAKTYKEDWGFHNCRFCQSCKRLNRHQKSSCTSRKNAVCGECLPGFYSKTRVDGLQDLECMPCGPSSNPGQCSRSRRVDVEKVWNSGSPTPNVAVANAVIVALVTMAIVLSVFLFIYLRRTLQKRLLKGCLAFQSRSQTDTESASSTLNTVTPNLKQEGHDAAVNALTTLPSSMEEFGLRGFISFYPHHQPQDSSQMLETQPLVRNSNISNGSLGFVSQTSSEPASDKAAVEPPAVLEDCGEPATLLHTSYCASEHQGNYQHVPVECTELDIDRAMTVSSTPDLHRQTEPECSSTSVRIPASSESLERSPTSRLGEQPMGLSASLEE